MIDVITDLLSESLDLLDVAVQLNVSHSSIPTDQSDMEGSNQSATEAGIECYLFAHRLHHGRRHRSSGVGQPRR